MIRYCVACGVRLHGLVRADTCPVCRPRCSARHCDSPTRTDGLCAFHLRRRDNPLRLSMVPLSSELDAARGVEATRRKEAANLRRFQNADSGRACHRIRALPLPGDE